MTQKEFWNAIQENLEIPFDIKEVVKIEPDLTGALFFDLEDGSSYTLCFDDTEIGWEDDNDV